MVASIGQRSATFLGRDERTIQERAILFSRTASPLSSLATTREQILSSSCFTLAGCVTTTFILHAAARGISIQELSTELEGDLDVRGLLGLDDSVSPGYEQIRIRMNVKAACSDEEVNDLLSYTQRHSPVCNTVCRPVPVKIERVGV
jgi:uncharacterized OsmC-like protein